VKGDRVSRPARSSWLNWPGLGEAILGLLLIALPLQTYSVYVNSIPAFSNSSLSLLEPLAHLVLTSTLSGILVVVLGIRRLLNVLRLGNVSGPATLLTVAKVLSEERYKRIMVAATLLYGLFFAVVSGTVVYRPMENFAQEYLIQAPSAVIAVCCGSTGLIPVLTVFLTNQVGLLVIPSNILILAAVSALVGLNATLVVCEYHNRPRGASGLLGLGAFTGLFTACPTCAGLFFSALVVGLGSSALVILPSTQLYFVVGTILVLIGGVYLSTRMLGQVVLGRCEREQRRTS